MLRREVDMMQQLSRPAEVRYALAQDIESIRRELEALSAQVERNYLRIGEYLVLLEERQLYLTAGHGSLWSFLDSIPTFNYERRTAEMLMRVWRTFGRRGKFPVSEEKLVRIGFAKAYQLTRLYEAGKLNAETSGEWFEKAERLSFREFRLEVDRELYGEEREELTWVSVSLRIPPDAKDRLEQIVEEIAFLEGITDPAEIKKRKGDLILKALEDWESYYAPVLYNEEYSREDVRKYKLKQIKAQVEGALGVRVQYLNENGEVIEL